jgi:hypothetical protein
MKCKALHIPSLYVISITMGYMLDGWGIGVQLPASEWGFFCYGIQAISESHLGPYQMDTRGLFSQGQSSQVVKLTAFTSPYILMAWDSIKCSENFAIYLYLHHINFHENIVTCWVYVTRQITSCHIKYNKFIPLGHTFTQSTITQALPSAVSQILLLM